MSVVCLRVLCLFLVDNFVRSQRNCRPRWQVVALVRFSTVHRRSWRLLARVHTHTHTHTHTLKHATKQTTPVIKSGWPCRRLCTWVRLLLTIFKTRVRNAEAACLGAFVFPRTVLISCTWLIAFGYWQPRETRRRDCHQRGHERVFLVSQHRPGVHT